MATKLRCQHVPIITLLLLTVVGCRNQAHVYLVGPGSLADAKVLIDGKQVAKLEGGRIPEGVVTTVDGSEAIFDVNPGRHRLVIQKDGFQPILLRIDCRTECYPAIPNDAVRPASENERDPTELATEEPPPISIPSPTPATPSAASPGKPRPSPATR